MQVCMRGVNILMPRSDMQLLDNSDRSCFLYSKIRKRYIKENKTVSRRRSFTKKNLQSDIDQTYVDRGLLAVGIPRIKRGLTLLRVIWAF